VSAIVQRTNQEHSYDVPCVIALPVVAGNPAYIDWVIAETSEATAVSAADRPAS
jgi:periplasmic divalent cation tolerance protein